LTLAQKHTSIPPFTVIPPMSSLQDIAEWWVSKKNLKN